MTQLFAWGGQSTGVSALASFLPKKSAFFIVQLSHPYMATGKTIAFTRRTFADKVMSLLFNMLSRLIITFLPRSKRLLISWLNAMIRQAKCLLPIYYDHALAILCKVTDKVFHNSGCGFHLPHALTLTILLESLMLTTCIRGFFLVIKHLST